MQESEGQPKPKTWVDRALTIGVLAIFVPMLAWVAFAYLTTDHGIHYRVAGGCQVVTAEFTGAAGVDDRLRVGSPWTSPAMEPPHGAEIRLLVTADPGCDRPVTCEIRVDNRSEVTQSGQGAVLCRAINR